jgi:hypothetical protein
MKRRNFPDRVLNAVVKVVVVWQFPMLMCLKDLGWRAALCGVREGEQPPMQRVTKRGWLWKPLRVRVGKIQPDRWRQCFSKLTFDQFMRLRQSCIRRGATLARTLWETKHGNPTHDSFGANAATVGW